MKEEKELAHGINYLLTYNMNIQNALLGYLTEISKLIITLEEDNIGRESLNEVKSTIEAAFYKILESSNQLFALTGKIKASSTKND